MGWYKLKSKANDWIRKGSYRIMLIAWFMWYFAYSCGVLSTQDWKAAQEEVRTRLQRQTWSWPPSSPLINTGSGQITWLAEHPFPHLWYGDKNSAYLLGHYEMVATKYWINLSDGRLLLLLLLSLSSVGLLLCNCLKSFYFHTNTADETHLFTLPLTGPYNDRKGIF